ncbi:hypothetical protein ACFQ1R_13135 [Mariniflexile jejuense]|uniref:Uncharacterized protein n=1 Tax=Mariniflexile jejuense TaxID=1173582 RepID=A0ABW3JLT5_9FLAO
MTDKEYKDIDDLLKSILNSDVFLYERKKGVDYKLFVVCKSLNLVRPTTTPNQYELDENGFIAIDLGFEKYYNNLIEGKKLDFSIKSKTDKKLRTEVRRAVLLLILGALLGYVPASMSEDKMTKAIESISTSIEKSTNLNSDFRNEFQQMYLEIDSLKNEIDSLKQN